MRCLYLFWDENVETGEELIVNVILRSSLKLKFCVSLPTVYLFSSCAVCLKKERVSFPVSCGCGLRMTVVSGLGPRLGFSVLFLSTD